MTPQDRDNRLLRTCAVNDAHGHVTRDSLGENSQVKRRRPRSRTTRAANSVRACTVEMYMEMSQQQFCARIYRKKAAEQMEPPDQAPAFTPTIRTPQCGHTVWGKTPPDFAVIFLCHVAFWCLLDNWRNLGFQAPYRWYLSEQAWHTRDVEAKDKVDKQTETEREQCSNWTSMFIFEWPWWIRIHHFGWSGHPKKEWMEENLWGWRMKLIRTQQVCNIIAA